MATFEWRSSGNQQNNSPPFDTGEGCLFLCSSHATSQSPSLTLVPPTTDTIDYNYNNNNYNNSNGTTILPSAGDDLSPPNAVQASKLNGIAVPVSASAGWSTSPPTKEGVYPSCVAYDLKIKANSNGGAVNDSLELSVALEYSNPHFERGESMVVKVVIAKTLVNEELGTELALVATQFQEFLIETNKWVDITADVEYTQTAKAVVDAVLQDPTAGQTAGIATVTAKTVELTLGPFSAKARLHLTFQADNLYSYETMTVRADAADIGAYRLLPLWINIPFAPVDHEAGLSNFAIQLQAPTGTSILPVDQYQFAYWDLKKQDAMKVANILAVSELADHGEGNVGFRFQWESLPPRSTGILAWLTLRNHVEEDSIFDFVHIGRSLANLGGDPNVQCLNNFCRVFDVRDGVVTGFGKWLNQDCASKVACVLGGVPAPLALQVPGPSESLNKNSGGEAEQIVRPSTTQRGLRRHLEEHRAKVAAQIQKKGNKSSQLVRPSTTQRGLRRHLEEHRAKFAATPSTPQQLRGLRKNAANHHLIRLETTTHTNIERDAGDEPHQPNTSTTAATNTDDPMTMDTSMVVPVPPMSTSLDIEASPHQTVTPTALLSVSTSNLVRANPVQEEDLDLETQNLQQAQQVDISAIQKRKADRRRIQNQCISKHLQSALFANVVCGILRYFLFDRYPSQTIPTEPPTLSASPSTAPIDSPTLFSQDLGILSYLPTTTQQSIQKPGTPQYFAWDWLQKYANVSGVNFTDSTTYPLQRKKELFALATFFYALGGPNWPEPIRNDWLIPDPKRHECTWFNTAYTQWDRNSEKIISIETSWEYEQCNEEQYTTSIVLDIPITIDFIQTLIPSETTIAPKTTIPDEITLPPEMSLLSSLRVLILGGIYHGGNLFIPQGFGLLSSLTEFQMKECALTGTLPTELGLLSNLQSLSFSDNSFTGTLPTELGLLSSLQYLSLNYNSFSRTLPTEFGLLSSLQVLFLVDNSLTGTLPTELGLLSSLQLLSLGNNSFTGPLPTELGLLSNFQDLSLWNNSFTGTIPSELGLMINLAVLDVSNLPFLTGTIPAELEDCISLGYLNFTGSSYLVGTIPDAICYLGNSSCQYSDPQFGVLVNCTLEFDCNGTLCGCDCNCSN